jgi:hypothetical protein
VSPGFFAPLDVPSVSGRDFIDDDGRNSDHAQRAADFIEGVQSAASAGSLPTVASGAHRVRPIDILYVVAYFHAEIL